MVNYTEQLLKYSRLLSEVNDLIAELNAIGKNNPSYRHVWQVYQKIVEIEKRDKELSPNLFDALPQIVSDIGEQYTGIDSGRSQSIHQNKDAQLLLQKANNSYESVRNLIKLMREICIRGATDTINNSQRQELINQLISLENDITRIADSTIYNTELIVSYNKDNKIWSQINSNNTNNKKSLGIYKKWVIQVDKGWTSSNQINIYTAAIELNALTKFANNSNQFSDSQSSLWDENNIGSIYNMDKNNSSQMRRLLPCIDNALETLNEIMVKNGSDVSLLRNTLEKSKEDVFSAITNLEYVLRNIAGYLKIKAGNNFTKSPKSHIPHFLLDE